MPLLVLLALAACASSLSVRIIDPIVPELARDLTSDVATVALLASAFAFPCALGQPILGPLGDALGKARMIKFCLAGLTLGSLGATLAPNIETLFVARIITGFASGGIVPLCFATVGDRFGMADRQVALSRILSAILLGQLGGAIGAGLIASASTWRVVLGLTTLVSLMALLAAWRYLQPLPGARRTPFTIERMVANYARVLAHPRALVCYCAVLVEGMCVFGVLPYLAVLLEADGAGSIREAGFVISGMAVGGILYTLAVKRMLRRVSFQTLIWLGGIVCALGLSGLALFQAWPLKAGTFLLVGYGFYMIHNSIQTQVTELAPDARGAAVGLHAFSFFLGQAIGPVLYGLGLSRLGAGLTIATAAGVMLLLGFATARGFTIRRSSPA
ncbi:MAG: MFS transporter [Gammaproteobacteria bacterium]|nr:MFS transporter [Gammaproteobacteria bacterium]